MFVTSDSRLIMNIMIQPSSLYEHNDNRHISPPMNCSDPVVVLVIVYLLLDNTQATCLCLLFSFPDFCLF